MANKMNQQADTHRGNDKVVPSQSNYSEDEVKNVPLDAIFVDTDLNARSIANVIGIDEKSDDKDAKGLPELQSSILAKGQDHPITLAPVILGTSYLGKKTTCPFQIVAGFRRLAVLQTVNADEFHKANAKAEGRTIVRNAPNGTVRAIVRTFDTVKDAMEYNLRENTARNAVTAPDVIHRVRDFYQVHKMTIPAIAANLGFTTQYTTRLVNVSGLPKKVVDHWRNGGKIKGSTPELEVETTLRLPIAEMEAIVKEAGGDHPLSADQQVDLYVKKLLPKGEGEEGENDNQWIEAGKKKAEALGRMLGALQRLEFLEVNADDATWAAVIVTGDLKVTGRKEFSNAIAKKFAKAALAGYAKGLEEPEMEPEEGQEGDAAPKWKGKGKK
jgi:ParB-like chromosome segregation protein Spo0J